MKSFTGYFTCWLSIEMVIEFCREKIHLHLTNSKWFELCQEDATRLNLLPVNVAIVSFRYRIRSNTLSISNRHVNAYIFTQQF